MNYKKLIAETWEQLDESGNEISGYKSIWLSKSDQQPSNLHIFKDKSGMYHFAIEISNNQEAPIEDPGVNGLKININQYKLSGRAINKFIDIRCNIEGYLKEFTEVTRDIAKSILDDGNDPRIAVIQTVRKWKAFWDSRNDQILSEEKQIGLICELKTLERLCLINPSNALDSWSGPLGEKHDFIFTAWSLEIKGTKRGGHTHTINGIDQLKPISNKQLALISFHVQVLDNINSLSLQEVIEGISQVTLRTKPDLVIKFNQLLARSGYSPIFASEYRKLKIEILEAGLFEVNDTFPCLTTDKLKEPLDSRISSVRYDISLDGTEATSFNQINWGNYFY